MPLMFKWIKSGWCDLERELVQLWSKVELAEDAESVVERDDDERAIRRHDTAVVRVAGPGVERVAVHEHDHRDQTVVRLYSRNNAVI